MEEKVIVSDSLNAINGSLVRYGEMISQTENQQLRQTLQQIRNATETSQFELYSIAKNKNYYQPAKQATNEQIQDVKDMITSICKENSYC